MHHGLDLLMIFVINILIHIVNTQTVSDIYRERGERGERGKRGEREEREREGGGGGGNGNNNSTQW